MTIDISPLTAALEAIKDSVSETEGQNKSPLHSPLPWTAWDDNRTIGFQDAAGEPFAIAEIVDHGDMASEETLTADLEFIARACNSHYELLEILEAIIAHDAAHWLKDTDRQCEEDICVQSDELEAILNRARAAIAKMRGQ